QCSEAETIASVQRQAAQLTFRSNRSSSGTSTYQIRRVATAREVGASQKATESAVAYDEPPIAARLWTRLADIGACSVEPSPRPMPARSLAICTSALRTPRVA